MELVTKEVEKQIANLLPDQFMIIMDGWSTGSTHCVGVFASYPSASEK